MQIPSKSVIIIPMLFLAVVACQKDEAFIEEEIMVIETPQGPKSYPGVSSSLWPYFERFEQAGAAHNINIDLSQEKLTGVIEDLPTESVAGQCTYYSHGPNHIIIDSEFWSRASDDFKEMIIFHELGHCVLDRDHREGQLDNGFCLSIMRSGEEPCRDVYNENTKDYYIEELFHPQRVD